eukprot:3405369-Prymnesium_polylepis.1
MPDRKLHGGGALAGNRSSARRAASFDCRDRWAFGRAGRDGLRRPAFQVEHDHSNVQGLSHGGGDPSSHQWLHSSLAAHEQRELRTSGDMPRRTRAPEAARGRQLHQPVQQSL